MQLKTEPIGLRCFIALPVCSQLRHQEIPGDELTQQVHPVQELRQVGVQAGVQDFIDAAVLQIGQQAPCLALAFLRVPRGPRP